LGKLYEKLGIPYQYGRGSLENIEQLHLDIISFRPSHVFNVAGITSWPNVDWCESHNLESIQSNVVGTLNLASVCKDHGIFIVNLASGCIFYYDDIHAEGRGIGYKEEDKPNYIGSFFSPKKAMVISNSSIYACMHFSSTLFSQKNISHSFFSFVSYCGSGRIISKRL
jgi:UDP-glucose 4,6-dehydratase